MALTLGKIAAVIGIIVGILTIINYFGFLSVQNPTYSSTITTQGQTGGTNIGQVFVQSPPQRVFEGEAKDSLIAILPTNKDTEIVVLFADGDVESFTFATKIAEYLVDSGYTNVQSSPTFGGQPFVGQSAYLAGDGVFYINIGKNG